LSIWREDGLFPLDHLVHRVRVEEPGAPVTCGEAGAEARGPLRGGLATLLDTSLSGLNKPGSSAHAALHVFETTMGKIAVFVDGRPGRSQKVYSWTLLTSLIEYLTDPLRLLKKIESARQKANNGDPSGYAEAARELALMLFSADGEDGETAERAKAALQELVRESTKPPVVVARLVSSEILDGRNRTAILPLGLLSAAGPDPVLSKPLVVVQPLPRERYSREACIDPWTFGVPAELHGVVDDKVLEALAVKDPPQWDGQRLHTLSALKNYLLDEQRASGAKGEGLLVLAHQAGGQLWFNDPGERIQPQEIRRIYAEGSVAVFAACSTASPDGNNRAILDRFNARGIDAIVASPFPVTIDYAVPLTLEFAGIVGEHRKAGRTPTFLELFTEATQRTAQKLTDTGGRFEQMGLEYILLGDPDLKLCGPPSPPVSPSDLR